MQSESISGLPRDGTRPCGVIESLLHAEPAFLRSWLAGGTGPSIPFMLGVLWVGAGLFGAAVGCWRSEQQALITAIKLPLILSLTAAGNSVLNAALAPLLGLNLGFRQTTLAILASLAMAAILLGSLSPLLGFLVWNLPAMEGGTSRGFAHALLLLSTVAAIAAAGLAANLRLFRFLVFASGSRSVAVRILFAWLTVNLLLGTQLTWIARPFFGSPHLPVQWLRADAFSGNFLEATAYSVRRVLNP
ncbi:MAG: hypothetical protein JNL10_06140 [Verrucomicrobiales bacterium]|nr:hypothetical protein [Verrucomicrobiales bacterium]